MNGRPPVKWTVRALRSGQLAAVAMFVVALALKLAGHHDGAALAAALGVLIVVGTPALGLGATMLEARHTDRATLIAAVLVAGVLAAATGLALFIGG